MSIEKTPSTSTFLLTFLAGAALGAVVVALTTPKSGPELRDDLSAFRRRTLRKARSLGSDACSTFSDLKQRTAMAANDFKGGVSEAVNDLRG